MKETMSLWEPLLLSVKVLAHLYRVKLTEILVESRLLPFSSERLERGHDSISYQAGVPSLGNLG